MNPFVSACLSSLRFGERQVFEGMTVFPILDGAAAGPEYVSLRQALEKGWLTVTEVSEGGSVPNLRVENAADVGVLLLDGEELVGAKQNRVLNTSVLLAPHSETIIPVSCTEAGRWSYVSPVFEDSDLVAAASVRRMKSASVTRSLEHTGEFQSDQVKVWDAIDAVASRARAESPTRALRDVFLAKEKRLEEYQSAFPGLAEQKGLVACLGETVLGLDLVSRPAVYAELHAKLVKSYAMEAILQETPPAAHASEDTARAFLAGLQAAEERTYPSVGLGTDYRYRAKELVASALVHENEVVHLAAFRAEAVEDTGTMSGFRSRRGFRV